MAVRIILIHGLNNSMEAFEPLRDKFNSIGYDCHILCLPGHGGDRDEARDLKTAFHHFDLNMKKLIQDPYVVVAFSHGALFLQLWLEKNILPKPRSQILLAPALYIRNFPRLYKMVKLLPSFLTILSVQPRKLRRYWYLHVREYRTLFEGARRFLALGRWSSIPTHIMVDPKDEVVDAQIIQYEVEKQKFDHLTMEFIERPSLKGQWFGKYHILFHPAYFAPDEWDKFISKMDQYIKKHL